MSGRSNCRVVTIASEEQRKPRPDQSGNKVRRFFRLHKVRADLINGVWNGKQFFIVAFPEQPDISLNMSDNPESAGISQIDYVCSRPNIHHIYQTAVQKAPDSCLRAEAVLFQRFRHFPDQADFCSQTDFGPVKPLSVSQMPLSNARRASARLARKEASLSL